MDAEDKSMGFAGWLLVCFCVQWKCGSLRGRSSHAHTNKPSRRCQWNNSHSFPEQYVPPDGADCRPGGTLQPLPSGGLFVGLRALRRKIGQRKRFVALDDLRRVPRELHSSKSHGASRCDAYLLRAEFSDYSNCNPIVRLQRNHFQCVGRRRESSFADRLARQCVCVCVMRRRRCNKAQCVTTRVRLDTSRGFYIPARSSFTPPDGVQYGDSKVSQYEKEVRGRGLRSICPAFIANLVLVCDLAGLLQPSRIFFQLIYLFFYWSNTATS